MYIHYTGYVISDKHYLEHGSIPSLLYILSTESSFFFEFLDVFWTTITDPFPYSRQTKERPFSMNLMGLHSYHTAVKNLLSPVEIMYAKGFGSMRRYNSILYSRD